jgi:hypothetical protein
MRWHGGKEPHYSDISIRNWVDDSCTESQFSIDKDSQRYDGMKLVIESRTYCHLLTVWIKKYNGQLYDTTVYVTTVIIIIPTRFCQTAMQSNWWNVHWEWLLRISGYKIRRNCSTAAHLPSDNITTAPYNHWQEVTISTLLIPYT